MIVGSGVTSVLPSPDFGHLLIERETYPLIPGTAKKEEEPPLPSEVSLVWWNVRTRRSSVAWKHVIAPGEDFWFQEKGWVGKTGFAIYRLETGKESITVFVRPSTGEAREVVMPPKSDTNLVASPTKPFIGIVGADVSCRGAIPFMSADGTIGAPIPLPGTVFFIRWSEDGSQLLGKGYNRDATGKDVEQWYTVNPATRTVSSIARPPKASDGRDEYEYFGDPAEALPLRLTQDPYSLDKPDQPRAIYWEAFPKSAERVLLSLDGEPLFILPDGSGAFFRRDSALYFAPSVSIKDTNRTMKENEK